MGNNIKEKLIKGTLWNTIEKVAIKSASFVIGILWDNRYVNDIYFFI